MSSIKLTEGQLKLFQRDGYIIIKDFCSKKEVNRLYKAALNDTAGTDNISRVNGQSAIKPRQPYWYNQANDVFGYLSRSEKIINSVTQLLEGNSPVCHIKSNLVQKEPCVGGVWQWHQDYSYWYKNNFMFPDQLVSVMVALTDINRTNGCSQLIKGSHKLGRINHGFEGQQVGADMNVVNNSLQRMELVYAELAAGDAIFFHSNLLHRSDANLSDHSFWSVISCYASKSNVPLNKNFHSWLTPVEMIPDEAITEWESETAQEVSFINEEITDTWKLILSNVN